MSELEKINTGTERKSSCVRSHLTNSNPDRSGSFTSEMIKSGGGQLARSAYSPYGMTIAQRFSAGFGDCEDQSPARDDRTSFVPNRDWNRFIYALLSHEWLGYFQKGFRGSFPQWDHFIRRLDAGRGLGGGWG
jgi:hypothetical protein